MILGFGNNVVSSLASDITASQTTFSVIPGDGPLFASLLTSDFSNKSTTLKNYAKITLTDSGETAFEVCHLTAVSGDTLTVIRGQEGTAAKGWSLKDVVANFATRGSENAFPQIAHIQSGFYTSGTAGGTANALTLELPTTFFLNGSADWVLKTPIVVYPSQNNTGAATLQLTMGGRVLGTFKLYKGNKAELVANDILKDVALVCLMDNTRTFFNVANPGAIYAGLGTAAFANLVTSTTDQTLGRVPTVGWMGLGGIAPRTPVAGANSYDNIPIGLPSGFWTHAVAGGPYAHTLTLLQDGGGSRDDRHLIIPSSYADKIAIRWDSGTTKNYQYFYTDKNKPSAADVGAVPSGRKVNGHTLTNDVNVTAQDIFNGQAFGLSTEDLDTLKTPGIYYQPANANTSAARHYPENNAGTLLIYKNAGVTQVYIVYNSSRTYTRSQYSTGAWTAWAKQYDTANKPSPSDIGAVNKSGDTMSGTLKVGAEVQSTIANSFRIAYGGYGTFWRNDGNNLYLMLTNNNDPWGGYNALRPFRVSLASGAVVSETPFSVTNTLTASKEVTAGYSGAYAWADQYKTKAPFFNSYSTTGTSEYHPVIKQQATIASKNSWAFSFGSLVAGTELSWHLHMKGSGGSEVNFKWDTNGNFNAPGQVNPGSYANFDARYFTQTAANARFLQGWRLGAVATATNGNNDNLFAEAPNGAVVVSVQQKTNYTAVKYRYSQYNLNGTWYNAGVV
ncbi:TPA: pyocin knob domain-containing protein [Enterobacter hormaechei]